MAGPYPLQSNQGLFIPTTINYDVSQIQDMDVKSKEFKELIVRLVQAYNVTAMAVNLKDTGYYTLEEFLNSQVFFPNPTLTSKTAQTPVFRQVFRKVVDFGTLPNNATKTVAHGINIIAPANTMYSFTKIYATATDPVGFNYIPIPYASSVAADIIELKVNATNVSITTVSNKTAFTKTYVVLEYIKQ